MKQNIIIIFLVFATLSLFLGNCKKIKKNQKLQFIFLEDNRGSLIKYEPNISIRKDIDFSLAICSKNKRFNYSLDQDFSLKKKGISIIMCKENNKKLKICQNLSPNEAKEATKLALKTNDLRKFNTMDLVIKDNSKMNLKKIILFLKEKNISIKDFMKKFLSHLKVKRLKCFEYSLKNKSENNLQIGKQYYKRMNFFGKQKADNMSLKKIKTEYSDHPIINFFVFNTPNTKSHDQLEIIEKIINIFAKNNIKKK